MKIFRGGVANWIKKIGDEVGIKTDVQGRINVNFETSQVKSPSLLQDDKNNEIAKIVIECSNPQMAAAVSRKLGIATNSRNQIIIPQQDFAKFSAMYTSAPNQNPQPSAPVSPPLSKERQAELQMLTNWMMMIDRSPIGNKAQLKSSLGVCINEANKPSVSSYELAEDIRGFLSRNSNTLDDRTLATMKNDLDQLKQNNPASFKLQEALDLYQEIMAGRSALGNLYALMQPNSPHQLNSVGKALIDFKANPSRGNYEALENQIKNYIQTNRDTLTESKLLEIKKEIESVQLAYRGATFPQVMRTLIGEIAVKHQQETAPSGPRLNSDTLNVIYSLMKTNIDPSIKSELAQMQKSAFINSNQANSTLLKDFFAEHGNRLNLSSEEKANLIQNLQNMSQKDMVFEGVLDTVKENLEEEHSYTPRMK